MRRLTLSPQAVHMCPWHVTVRGWQVDGAMLCAQDNIDELRGAMERMKFSYVAYSHAAFADLRELFGVDAAGYTKSLGGHKDAKFDGGASGAIMFFSADKRYIIKQVEKAERETLVKLLPGYHEHMRENDGSTMLLRVLQCCSIRMYRKELNFMVTENLFYHQGVVVKPDATYDIKGRCAYTIVYRPFCTFAQSRLSQVGLVSFTAGLIGTRAARARTSRRGARSRTRT